MGHGHMVYHALLKNDEIWVATFQIIVEYQWPFRLGQKH